MTTKESTCCAMWCHQHATISKKKIDSYQEQVCDRSIILKRSITPLTQILDRGKEFDNYVLIQLIDWNPTDTEEFQRSSDCTWLDNNKPNYSDDWIQWNHPRVTRMPPGLTQSKEAKESAMCSVKSRESKRIEENLPPRNHLKDG